MVLCPHPCCARYAIYIHARFFALTLAVLASTLYTSILQLYTYIVISLSDQKYPLYLIAYYPVVMFLAGGNSKGGIKARSTGRGASQQFRCWTRSLLGKAGARDARGEPRYRRSKFEGEGTRSKRENNVDIQTEVYDRERYSLYGNKRTSP
jgi:hypothetical protein